MRRYVAWNWARASWVVLAAVIVLAGVGCNSSSTSDDTRQAGSHAQIEVNCIGDRIQNPPEAFHYSYKTDGPDAVDKEADITQQSMDITVRDKSGSHNYHGVRSDEASWNSAVLDLSGSGFTVMSARIDFVKDKSATVGAGTETMNGYDTTKYSIDTTKANSSDQNTFSMMFGAGSYDKGTIWVTAQGCPVKLILDEAKKDAKGNLNATHYEMAMVKK